LKDARWFGPPSALQGLVNGGQVQILGLAFVRKDRAGAVRHVPIDVAMPAAWGGRCAKPADPC